MNTAFYSIEYDKKKMQKILRMRDFYEYSKSEQKRMRIPKTREAAAAFKRRVQNGSAACSGF